jgi:hypothetical protein
MNLAAPRIGSATCVALAVIAFGALRARSL